ncbi:protein of unknown function [Oscillospiraceae bacterium]|nr:protein of unknown function [Oscillospiraceae bacterium]
MSFDILTASKNITEKYTRYLKTVFDIDNSEYKALFDKRMSEIGSFSKGPFLDVVDSFESGRSVRSLIDSGTLNQDFIRIPKIYDKTLYVHQERAIEKIQSGHNIVVSTGTGSGKTESFLIPILNSLMNERQQKGVLTPGVRALLIYPMNALANDQISRLRELLADYPFITFGSYTGQTEEKYDKALSKYKTLNHGNVPLENELISREQMKDTPPNILITNYSMLEYLMLRPRDNTLFQGKYAGNWEFVVLDEAHTYSGSTGIEVSMLLRRLYAHLDCPKIQYILTSATLGSGDSDNEVALFGSRLCNAEFYPEDVIRATRIKLSRDTEGELSLSIEDYVEMNDIIESGFSDDRVLSMLSKYLSMEPATSDYSELLFDLLIKDSTFWRVKLFLKTPQTVNDISGQFDWDDDQLSAFINVASHASKSGKKLFDSRYHMFIRATDGVFVTLGNHKDLSLTRQTTKYINDTEYKYFEVVTCTQCHALYLFGSIEEENGKRFLKQKAGLSGDNIREAFLIGDVVSDDDEDAKLNDEHLSVSQYELCPHCGMIREKNQVHKTRCSHSEAEFINLTKVKNSEVTGRVTKCIHCEGTNNAGILRSFFAGQEASTSVVGTALFEELPQYEASYTPVSRSDDGFDDGFDDYTEVDFTNKAKQFIAFSDNRQAAAYFATYFYESYQSLLYSRIVNRNIQKLDDEARRVPRFVKDMVVDFRNNHIAEMFETDPDYQREAWKAVMKELINSYSRNSLSGLGLMQIGIEENFRVPKNSKYDLSVEDVHSICMVLLRNMLEDNAIIVPYNFVDSDIAFYSNNGSSKVYQLSATQNYIRSFVPRNDKSTNKRYDYIRRVFESKGIDEDHDAILSFMSAVWNRLEKNEVIIDRYDHEGKQIDLSKLEISNARAWYRCDKCHRLTPYNVNNVCPSYKCDGKLEPVNVDELEKENHYYRIYNDLNVQSLRVAEHTAQLQTEEAYRIQDLFKNKEIDVLSCSTTFEMGVDIGELETVFMRNMPPTPSNYIQRAGRAGRSKKSAALALTFCNKSNHDFSFFNDPISMINGEIQPPLFKVENEKIGIRHLYSSAFASFWRVYDGYFGRIADFFGAESPTSGYSDFKKYLESKPVELKQLLLNSLPDELVAKFEVDSFGWVRWLFDEPDSSYPNLKAAYEQYRTEVESLYSEKRKIEDAGKDNGAIIHRINTYIREDIISFLSRNNILPKYGFPVDTVELKISANKDGFTLPIDLSRDLSMAISEYAPGCEVIAAGNLIKSRYIRRIPNKSWRQYDYVHCFKCQALNIEVHHDIKDNQTLVSCSHCGNPFGYTDIRTFIIPEFGFGADPTIGKPSLIKPERTYRTEASMVAEGSKIHQESFDVGGLSVNTTILEDGEIAILNKSEFYVCPSCGYSLSAHEAKAFTPYLTSEHKNPAGGACKNKILTKYSLGYRFKTDALLLRISDLYSYSEAYSILQAVILSACSRLNLDNTEISGCLQYSVNQYGPTYDFIIYDTTPGGAGHVKRLADSNAMTGVLIGAYNKANNCDCGGSDADTSCYKCLRTYQNQQHHDTLKRRYVIEKLAAVVEDYSRSSQLK